MQIAQHRFFPKRSPRDPDPASLPPTSLLLSAALSFSPFGAPPPARRDWRPPRCPGPAHRLGFQGRHRGQPHPWRGGAARGRPAGGGEAALRRFRARPPPGLPGTHNERRRGVGPAAWHAARRSGQIPPRCAQRPIHVLIAGFWSPGEIEATVFSFRLCI